MIRHMELNEFLIKEGSKNKYILDTSVIIKWYSQQNEDDLEMAMLFYQQVKENQVIIISLDLMVFELLNFFICRLKLPKDKLSKILSEIYDIIFIINSNKALHEEAYEIADSLKNTIYDSSFVALSVKLQYPLFTADNKLCKAAKASGYDVFHISDYRQFF
jgi:predicted nucleic acid-binding protein